MLVKYIFVIQLSIFFNQQIAQSPLFQMRYDSLLSSEKWPSDSPKGSGTPCFRPTHSVQVQKKTLKKRGCSSFFLSMSEISKKKRVCDPF